MSDLDKLEANDIQRLRAHATGFGNQATSDNGPLYVEVHLTDKCNAACYFCNQKEYRRGGGHTWDPQLFDALMAQLASHGLRMVRLSGGGDPTVYPYLPSALNTIRRLGLTLARFDTNGIELTREVSDMLLATNIQMLHISLQVPLAHLWAQVTGRDAEEFHNVLENIETFQRAAARSHGASVRITFVIDMITANLVPQMTRLCESLNAGFAIHELNCYTYSAEFINAGLPRMLESLGDSSGEAVSFSAVRRTTPGGQEPESGEGPVQRATPCFAPWAGFVIKPNGNVVPCCNLQGDWHTLGNVHQTDVMDIWNGNEFAALRAEARALFFSGVYGREVTRLKYLGAPCVGPCPVRDGIFGCSRITHRCDYRHFC